MAHPKKRTKPRGNTFVGFAPRVQNGSKKVKQEQLIKKHKRSLYDHI